MTMTEVHPILHPLLALVCWSLVMWWWLYVTRLPAMKRVGIDPTKIQRKHELDPLPVEVHRVADNYNHLHEQPTIFYALLCYCALTGFADSLQVGIAWAYVGFRILHSLIQAVWNFVPLRFVAFTLSSLCLMALTLRCVFAVLP